MAFLDNLLKTPSQFRSNLSQSPTSNILSSPAQQRDMSHVFAPQGVQPMLTGTGGFSAANANMSDAKTGAATYAPPPGSGQRNVQGDFTLKNPYVYNTTGGGGINMAAYNAQFEATKQAQQQLADQERANIEARRDALVSDTEAGFGDQMKYLDTQEQGVRSNVDLGRQRINAQRNATIAQAQQDAEAAAQIARDTYRDLIVQGRRRARATGAGQSSGYVEITGMLDRQLMGGLNQVNQTKEGKVAGANSVADNAVGEIERTLVQVLGEIANNRALSLREKDRAINEARMNAADAMLEVDKWLTNTYSDIETAKLELNTRARSGGGRTAGYDKQAYQQIQAENQAKVLDRINQEMLMAQEQGGFNTDIARGIFNNYLPAYLQSGGNINSASTLSGMYIPTSPKPDTSLFAQYRNDPDSVRNFLFDQANARLAAEEEFYNN